MLVKRDESLLILIDVQERLVPAMDEPREVINGCARLVGVAKALNVPFIITEQYSKGLGRTMIDVRNEAGENAEYFEKLEFSCAQNEELLKKIKNFKKKQVILAGVEAHICVLQTAIDLKDMGYDVFVVSNASSSRNPLQTVVAYQRLMRHGIDIVTSEMVFFEWLQKAGTEEFKRVSQKYIANVPA